MTEGTKADKRAGALFLAVSLCIIIFFTFFTVKTALYAEDPLRDFGALAVSSRRAGFTFVPTSSRPVSLAVRTGAAGREIALEMEAGGERYTLFSRTDEEGYALFTFPEGTVMASGEPVSAVINAQDETSFYLQPDGTLWHRAAYLWADRDTVRALAAGTGMVYALVLWFFAVRRKVPAEKVFLMTALPAGILFAFVIPIYRAPDEVVHFMRSLGIAKGVLVLPADGAVMLPENIVPSYLDPPFGEYFSLYSLLRVGGEKLSGTLVPWKIPNAALYNPLVYVFSALGSGIAGIFSDDLYVIFLAGRLANVFGCTLMIWLAVKLIPDGKALLCLVSLMPINLQERASVSADAVTYAAAVLLTAYVLYMRYGDKKMDRRHIIYMYGLLLLTGACKVVYFAMALCILLIPKEKFSSSRSAAFHRIFGIVLTTAFALAWIALANRYLADTQGGGNSAEKVIYALTHPFWYIKLMAATCAERLPGWGLQMTAPPFGYFDIPVSVLFGALLALMLAGWTAGLWIVRIKKGLKRDAAASAVMILASFAVTMLIFASLYVQWTTGEPPEIYLIDGIQGRYFLPFLPALLMGVAGVPASDRTGAEGNAPGRAVTGISGVIGMMVLVNIIMSCSAV